MVQADRQSPAEQDDRLSSYNVSRFELICTPSPPSGLQGRRVEDNRKAQSTVGEANRI